MKTQNAVRDKDTALADAAFGPSPVLPIRIAVSGLYSTAGVTPGLLESLAADSETGAGTPPFPITPAPSPLLGEELRLDVDGRYPQMTASGTIPLSNVQRLTWIAKVKAVALNKYAGGIWYKDPANAAFAYTGVELAVTAGPLPSNRAVTARFTGAGLPVRTRVFAFRSPYFHKVELEYDCEKTVTPDLSIKSWAHPNHPATLPNEDLTITKVYQRAGFDVSLSPSPTVIPPGPGGTWSDMEMHDAMVTYWSRFANKPQWAMWVFVATQHEMGPSLGGIMFDDIGPNHRQGTSLFYNSFISTPPAGDAAGAEHVKRMHFWTAVHEMGHAFDLAHSWQKALGVPWIPLTNEPEARSFMNYPYNVAGGQSAFFANFEYRFSDTELLFMRHAPYRFVRMGDAAWFDHHAFQQANVSPEPRFSLEIRVNRSQPKFEFLEPVVAELKLKNISGQPQIVNEHMLTTLDGITIATKRQGSPARQYIPFAQYCMQPAPKTLQPGEAIYQSVFLTAGLNGIDVAEPGNYVIQAALHLPDGDIVSPPLPLRISAPRGFDEEAIAQDFFQIDVARVLAFDGSRVLTDATNVLREVTVQLSGRRVAKHARVALGLAVAQPSKVLTAQGSDVLPARPEEARTELTTALLTDPDVAAETMGHIDYKYYVDKLTDLLVKQGERKEAAQAQATLHQILAARGVLPRVLQEIDTRRKSLQATHAGRASPE